MIKKKLKQFWDYINGHKTIIFLTAATVMREAVNYDLVNDSKGVSFAIVITTVLGGGSLVHHVKKGLKKKK